VTPRRSHSPRLFRCVLLTAGLTVGLGSGCKLATSSVTPDAEPGLESDEATAGATPTFASAGVPHSNVITIVALDPSGRAAVSVDASGGVRLWPALDGSREPLVVPVQNPRSVTLASDGAGGWIIALVDAGGGARIVGVDQSGAMQPLASLPPTSLIGAIEVLPGGRGLLSVGTDHTLRLLATDGSELALADANGFRPTQLRLAFDGDPEAGELHVLAVTSGEFNSDKGRFTVEIIPLILGEDSLSLDTAHRQTLDLDAPATPQSLVLSPDGRTLVHLQRQNMGSAGWVLVATQLADGRQVSVDTQVPTGLEPRIGLLPSGRVLVDDGTGMGRIVDLGTREITLEPLRASPTVNHLVVAFAGDTRIAPAGNWLAVHDLEHDKLSYLGYSAINVTDAGLSPTAGHVAWALADRLLVEDLGESEQVFEVPHSRGTNLRLVDFVDEDRLVTVDWIGGAELITWRDGEVVDAIDLGNNIQLADFARHAEGGILLARTNLWQNPTLVALRGDGFEGGYLLPTPTHLTGIMARAGSALDSCGSWALDGSGHLRHFDLSSLRAGIDVKSALEATGELLPFGVPEQLVEGPRGELYWARTEANHPVLHVHEPGEANDSSAHPASSKPARAPTSEPVAHAQDAQGQDVQGQGQGVQDERRIELAPGFIALMDLSPDGRRLAIVQQRDPGQVLTIYDTRSLSPLWAQPIPPTQSLAWSDDGQSIVVPAQLGGGGVFGPTGEVQSARCGLSFERRHTPPVNNGFFNQLSICEL